MLQEVEDIIKENTRRLAVNNAPFNPVTGRGSVGQRIKVVIDGFPIKTQWLPERMMTVPLVKKLVECGSLDRFMSEAIAEDYSEEDRLKVIEKFVRIRCRHDFAFWAAVYVRIKNKGGGEDVLFRLTRPQRRFVERLEQLRLAAKPIRLILLKARQWGGSALCYLLIYLYILEIHTVKPIIFIC